MTVFYKTRQGGRDIDLDDLYVRRSVFQTGNAWVWGRGDSGQLGDNTTVNKSSPVQVLGSSNNWKKIGSGFNNNAGIKTDGSMWLWGPKLSGSLGDNTATGNSSSPVQTITASTDWYSSGVNAAIKIDGSLWVWGSNYAGRLGDNTATSRSSPVQTVTRGNNWKQVADGSNHMAAVKTDGTLWCWGDNDYGTLGDSSSTRRSSPVQTVTAGNNWSSVAVGSTYTAAIKTDGTLWLWGFNSYGELGTNNTTSRSSPVQTVTGGNDWKILSTGTNNNVTAAIKTDGTLWLWGDNFYGQLGTNNTISRSSPVQTVARGTNWRAVSVGYLNCAAIKTDGTLWTWGYNGYGDLGDNTTIGRSSPVQTVAGGSNWLSVISGGYFTIALRQ